jgi:hypothetical protein
MTTRDTSHLSWVVEHMPEASAMALNRFTTLNPHWQGAHWDDCLDTLMDADANLEVTEPLWEAARESVHSGHLVTAVGLTYLYASQAFAEMSPEARWVVVDSTIRNDGMPRGILVGGVQS